jgi:hypothetical protein
MTELEMAMTLGILPEPVRNRVEVDAFLQAEITYLSHVFAIAHRQKQAFGTVNQDMWCELLPWHSMN